MARFFSQSDIDEFKECFYLYAKKKHITKEDELSLIMRSLSYSPTQEEIRTYFKNFVRDEKIDFATFLEVLHVHSKVENCQKEVMGAFQAHDIQKTGTIPAQELRNLLTNFGERLTKKEVDAMLREANIPTAGHVPYAALMKGLLTPVPDY